MFHSNKDVKFSFKALINKQKTKVLFAEIDSDFADVLFSILTLPLGKIVQILKKHYGDDAPVFGSLTTLSNGLSNLDETHFSAKGCKQMLLNPPSSFIDYCRKLKLDIGDTEPTKYFYCDNSNCVYLCVGMHRGTVRCDCGKEFIREIPGRNVSPVEVFTKTNTTFILSDDLEVIFPNATTSARKIISNLGLVDLDGTELRNVTFGFNEIMDLLKGSILASHTPLTDIILKDQTKYETDPVQIDNRETCNKTKYEAAVPVQIENSEASNGVGFVIIAILQKSTNKLLFVEAGEDFVEFLFSLLTIPLGKVESLLCGNTCMKGVDSLYRSIACPVERAYLRNAERSRLINPTIPHGYGSKKQIFSLVEERSPLLSFGSVEYSRSFKRATSMKEEYCSYTFKSPKGKEDYLNGPRRYMVKDDLTATTLSATSYISTMIEQKIPLSDVDEKRLKIGLQEASGILKASLTSTCALSNGLNHLLMKQPKQDEYVVVKHEH